MINFLTSQSVLQLETTTLVGHSLGAHVMGIAGRKVTGGKVNQIFGNFLINFSFFEWNEEK